MNRLRVLLAGLSLLAISTNATPGIADTVKVVVPFAAGGPVDQLARILAAELASVLGDNVIVENRGGAGGALGSEMVARSAPDGSTILLASLGSQVLSLNIQPHQGLCAGNACRFSAIAPRDEPKARCLDVERSYRQGEAG